MQSGPATRNSNPNAIPSPPRPSLASPLSFTLLSVRESIGVSICCLARPSLENRMTAIFNSLESCKKWSWQPYLWRRIWISNFKSLQIPPDFPPPFALYIYLLLILVMVEEEGMKKKYIKNIHEIQWKNGNLSWSSDYTDRVLIGLSGFFSSSIQSPSKLLCGGGSFIVKLAVRPRSLPKKR